MKHLTYLALFLSPCLVAGNPVIATLGEPLKEQYIVLDGVFYKTDKSDIAYSMSCDMGEANPNPEKDGWYINSPIKGLTLELEAIGSIQSNAKRYKSIGFVKVVKNGDVLKVFKPLGNYESDGTWDGDIFNSWSSTETEIELKSERHGNDGFAYFDLMKGTGWYYKNKTQEAPNFMLTNCSRSMISELPVYDWKFDILNRH